MTSRAAQLVRLLQRSAVPCLMAVVALYQLHLVSDSSLSRWRGGGFGMYSEFHPSTRRVWITAHGLEPPGRFTLDGARFRQLRHLEALARRLPSRVNLARIARFVAAAEDLPEFDAIEVEVWALVFEPDTRTLRWELLERYASANTSSTEPTAPSLAAGVQE